MSIAIRTIAIAIWTVITFGALGGGFVYREDLASGLYNRYTITMYKTLAPAPRGPAYCDFLTISPYALTFPCNLKPPFVGWLQGGHY